jgi:hypothetical protein
MTTTERTRTRRRVQDMRVNPEGQLRSATIRYLPGGRPPGTPRCASRLAGIPTVVSRGRRGLAAPRGPRDRGYRRGGRRVLGVRGVLSWAGLGWLRSDLGTGLGVNPNKNLIFMITKTLPRKNGGKVSVITGNCSLAATAAMRVGFTDRRGAGGGLAGLVPQNGGFHRSGERPPGAFWPPRGAWGDGSPHIRGGLGGRSPPRLLSARLRPSFGRCLRRRLGGRGGTRRLPWRRRPGRGSGLARRGLLR